MGKYPVQGSNSYKNISELEAQNQIGEVTPLLLQVLNILRWSYLYPELSRNPQV